MVDKKSTQDSESDVETRLTTASGKASAPPADLDSISDIIRRRAAERSKPVVRIARHFAGRATSTVTPTASSAKDTADSAFVITILSGRHTGAEARVKNREFSIGRAFSSDIIISDSGVAATHLKIAPKRGLLSSINVTAMGSNALVAAEPVEVGQTVIAYLPADIQIGDVRIRIANNKNSRSSTTSSQTISSSADSAAETREGFNLNWRTFVAVPLLAILGAALWPTFYSASKDAAAAMSAAMTQAGQTIIGTNTRDVNEITAALEQAGLKDDITIASHGDGLIARGQLSSAKHTQWADVKKTLESKGLVIVDQVYSSSSSEPSRGLIAAISLGDQPYVVTSSGKKVRIGEPLEGGWVIKELRSNAVVVERGNSKTTIVP